MLGVNVIGLNTYYAGLRREQQLYYFESMEMQQVTFSYYGSTKPDVENVSMMLKKGEKLWTISI